MSRTSVVCSKFKTIRKNMIGSGVAANQNREPLNPAMTAQRRETTIPINNKGETEAGQDETTTATTSKTTERP